MLEAAASTASGKAATRLTRSQSASGDKELGLGYPLDRVSLPSLVLAEYGRGPGPHVLGCQVTRVPREGEGLLRVVEHVPEGPGLEEVVMERARGRLLSATALMSPTAVLSSLRLDLLGGEGGPAHDDEVRPA